MRAVELRLPLERQLGSEKEKEIAEEPEWEEVEIEEELRRGVERAGREQGVSEEAVLLACWQALLARLTGKREIYRQCSLTRQELRRDAAGFRPLCPVAPSAGSLL